MRNMIGALVSVGRGNKYSFIRLRKTNEQGLFLIIKKQHKKANCTRAIFVPCQSIRLIGATHQSQHLRTDCTLCAPTTMITMTNPPILHQQQINLSFIGFVEMRRGCCRAFCVPRLKITRTMPVYHTNSLLNSLCLL